MTEYIDVTGAVLVDARTGRNRPLAQAQVLPAGQASVPVNLYRRAEDTEAEAFLNLPPDAARALAHALLRAVREHEDAGPWCLTCGRQLHGPEDEYCAAHAPAVDKP